MLRRGYNVTAIYIKFTLWPCVIFCDLLNQQISNNKNSLSGNGFTANPALCVIIRQNTSINKLNTSTNSSEKDGLIFLSKIPGKSQLYSTR